MLILEFLEARFGLFVESIEIVQDNARSPLHPASGSMGLTQQQPRRRHQKHQSSSSSPHTNSSSYSRRASHPQLPRKSSTKRSTSRWEGAAVQKDHQLTPVSRKQCIAGSVEGIHKMIQSMVSEKQSNQSTFLPLPLQEDFVMKIPSRHHSPDLSKQLTSFSTDSPEQEANDSSNCFAACHMTLRNLSPPPPPPIASNQTLDVQPRMPVKIPSTLSLDGADDYESPPNSTASKRWMILNNIDQAMCDML
jgi:hypothetical protein